MAAWMSARVPDTTIVVGRHLVDHYAQDYHRPTVYIPNGVVEPTCRPPKDMTERFGLKRGEYLLFLGRLVPEKAPDMLIRAFRRMEGDLRLVIAGGSSFTGGYVDELQELGAQDPRVLFTGYVYGDLLDELYSNAAAFVLPSLLEGLPMTLLEAASYGTPVVASAIPPHREVLGEAGPGRRMFEPGHEDGLLRALEASVADPDMERAAAQLLRKEVLEAYRWEDVVLATENVYRDMLR